MNIQRRHHIASLAQETNAELAANLRHPRLYAAARIAFLLPNLGGGGVQKNTLTIAKGLHALGYQIDLVLCSDEGPLRSQIPKQFRIKLLPQKRPWLGRINTLLAGNDYWATLLRPTLLARRPSKTLGFLPALADYLRENQPAALLSAKLHLNIEAVLAKSIAKANTRVVVTQSNQFSQWYQDSREWRRRFIIPLAKKAYQNADQIICVSQGVADDLADQLKLNRDGINAIYNPVVTPELLAGMQQAVDHSWFHAGEPPVILSVGRPGQQKDFTTLLKAFARVRQQHDVRLVILGEARDPNKKQRRQTEMDLLMRQLDITDFVDFHGFVHNPYSYMAKAAVFVLASHYEGFGNVIAEALACGCPVISSDCPSGPAEILQNGACGKLVPISDAPAMAAAISATLIEKNDSDAPQRRAEDFLLEPIARDYAHVLLEK
ncbi:MAG: glycosyltransferase [Pseudomonadales bacterium]